MLKVNEYIDEGWIKASTSLVRPHQYILVGKLTDNY